MAKITIDISKARDIWRDKIRIARRSLFDQLDKDFMRAIETKDQSTLDRIASQKQLLRDATDDPRIDQAKTITELKAIWPKILGPNPFKDA